MGADQATRFFQGGSTRRHGYPASQLPIDLEAVFQAIELQGKENMYDQAAPRDHDPRGSRAVDRIKEQRGKQQAEQIPMAKFASSETYLDLLLRDILGLGTVNISARRFIRVPS